MTPSLQVKALSKRYGNVQALDSINLEFAAGEVHAVLGENGAGKSTLVNIIAGLTAPDSGEITLQGKPMKPDPTASRRAGIGVVHQHFTLVPEFTVAENIALFSLGTPARKLDVATLAKPALDKAAELGWEVDPNAQASRLSVGAQQRVEILKCLANEQQVLVFDEPTAPLGPSEVEDLLRILRRLAEEGRIVVLIAHKLAEVLAVADRISVLRRGKVVAANMIAAEQTAQSLAEMMVGELPVSSSPPEVAGAKSELQVNQLVVVGDRGESAIQNLSFSAQGGRIFGIGGVDGNGQTELAEALAGIRRHTGWILLDGKHPDRVAYIPADRHSDGLALGMTVIENLLLGRLHSWPKQKEVKTWAKGLIDRFDVRAPNPDAAVSDLSGGNQQKLIVARSLDSQPQIVVALNPTRGLDVKASNFVQDQLRLAASRGAVVVIVSADVDELHAVADEVRYLSRGQFTTGAGAAAVVGGTE
jgi:simple sugar transport system ATP-binding protein